MTPSRISAMAHKIADQSVLCDIESNALPFTDAQGVAWHDTSTMLDPREQPDAVIDMMLLALDYAQARGIVTVHPTFPHLMRITRKDAL